MFDILPLLRIIPPLPDRLDGLWQLCWEEAGALVLAGGAIAVMGLIQALRAR